MEKTKKYILFLLISFLFLNLVAGEQVLWNNDSNITIYDSWRDIDGSPLTGATCSYILYNPDLTINQSGIPSEFKAGIINFTLQKLPTIQTYPLIINCTDGIYNGTSTKDSLKIIDELPEGYKSRLESIENNTDSLESDLSSINSSIKDLSFIIKVNSPKFHYEAYEVDTVGSEKHRIRLDISSNAIEGDPTFRVIVPMETKEDIILTTPDGEPLPFKFKKDENGNSYIEFGVVTGSCDREDGIYDREFNCQTTTYYLLYLKEVKEQNLLTQYETQKQSSISTLFKNTSPEIKFLIILIPIAIILFLSIIFILVLVAIEKIPKKNGNNQPLY